MDAAGVCVLGVLDTYVCSLFNKSKSHKCIGLLALKMKDWNKP